MGGGGLTKFSPTRGNPPSPSQGKTLVLLHVHVLEEFLGMLLFVEVFSSPCYTLTAEISPCSLPLEFLPLLLMFVVKVSPFTATFIVWGPFSFQLLLLVEIIPLQLLCRNTVHSQIADISPSSSLNVFGWPIKCNFEFKMLKLH